MQIPRSLGSLIDIFILKVFIIQLENVRFSNWISSPMNLFWLDCRFPRLHLSLLGRIFDWMPFHGLQLHRWNLGAGPRSICQTWRSLFGYWTLSITYFSIDFFTFPIFRLKLYLFFPWYLLWKGKNKKDLKRLTFLSFLQILREFFSRGLNRKWIRLFFSIKPSWKVRLKRHFLRSEKNSGPIS